MGNVLFIIGICLTVLFTIPFTIFLIFIHKKKKSENKLTKVLKKGKNGCYHTSNKNLNVTTFGDSESYYLCEKCGEKVREIDLN